MAVDMRMLHGVIAFAGVWFLTNPSGHGLIHGTLVYMARCSGGIQVLPLMVITEIQVLTIFYSKRTSIFYKLKKKKNFLNVKGCNNDLLKSM